MPRMNTSQGAFDMPSLRVSFGALAAAAAVLPLLVTSSSSGATAGTSDSDSAGNKLSMTLYWDVNGLCSRPTKMTYKYTRNDGQFTAGWKAGKIRSLAFGCGTAANTTKNIAGPDSSLLSPGNVYTRTFSMPWTKTSYPYGFTGYAKVNLYRSTQGGTVSGTLCAQDGISGPFTGSNCGNF
jgi:hypothetical protein